MKSKIFNFILKSNQILFFLVAIGLITVMIISSLPHDYARPIVKIEKNIEQNNTKETLSETQHFKAFYRHLKDVFIIKIHADNITKKEALQYSSPRLSSGPYYNNNDHALVNLLFTKEDKKSYKLLKDDAYIVSLTLMKNNQVSRNGDYVYNENHFKLDKNIYKIVLEDTNRDNFLSTKDKQDIYISNYDGKQMKLILKDILAYKLVGDNLILITKKMEKEEEFYLFDVLDSNLKLLDTKY